MKSIELMKLGNNYERLYFFLCDNGDGVSHLASPPDSEQAEETVRIASLNTAFPCKLGTATTFSATNYL